MSPISLVNIDTRTMGNETYMKHLNSVFSRRAAAYAARFFQRTQTRSVIIDVSFNGGTHYEDLTGDQMLVESLKDNASIISALSFEYKKNSKSDFINYPKPIQTALLKQTVAIAGIHYFPILQKSYIFNSLIPPYPSLLTSGMRFFSASGAIYKMNLDRLGDDTQGLIRRWTPFSVYGGHYFPTLALGSVLDGEKKLKLSSDGWLSWAQDKSQGQFPNKVNLGQDGVPLIKWYGHGQNPHRPAYPEFSFGDIVVSEMQLECLEKPELTFCKDIKQISSKPLRPEQFKDRFVLIGFVFPNSGDEHPTLYSPKYPGIYIVANILDNLLHNDFVRPAPFWLNLALLLLLPLLLSVAAFRFRSVWDTLVVAVILSAGHFMLCLYAYHTCNLWIGSIYPILGIFACLMGIYIYKYLREYKQRQQMRFAFGKYVSPAVLQLIEQHPERVKLGGQRRKMTFLFSDIRGFTKFSDQNSPEAVQEYLTQYFSTMNNIIMHSYHGSINKLIGDAIMAYWGFPLDHEDHAFLAVSAAIAMRKAMIEWQGEIGKMPIHIGIGINTGEAMVGNIGSEDFMDFTVIGDSVNVASRLEGMNKTYGTTILISGATYNEVKDRIEARPLGWADLSGKSAQIEIYEPLRIL